jgi:hypothetical protein
VNQPARRFLKVLGRETKAAFTPRTLGGIALAIVAFWATIAGFLSFALGLHLARTLLTFIVFYLPALICFGSLIFASAPLLFNLQAQRYAMFSLFRKNKRGCWPDP